MIELPPPLWSPPKPAIIRAAKDLPLEAHLLPFVAPSKLKPPTSLSFFDIAQSTASTSVALPAGTKKGDLAILLLRCAHNAALTSSPPAGWSIFKQLNIGTTTALIGEAYYKVLTPADIAAGSVDCQSGSIATALRRNLLIFRAGSGQIIGTATAPGTLNGQITTGAPTTQTIAANTGSTVPLVVFGYGVAFDAVTPTLGGTLTTASGVVLLNGTSTNTERIAYLIYNASPASLTLSCNDTGNGTALISGWIQVA